MITCLQGHFEPAQADSHYWYLKPYAAGALSIDIYAVSVNVVEESGSITAILFDGATPLGSIVVAHPLTFNGAQNIGTLSLASADPSKIYRLEIKRGAAQVFGTREAHHYRIGLSGVDADLGINSQSFAYLEHNAPREVFQVNAEASELLSIALSTEMPDQGAMQASSISLQIRDRSSGLVLYPTQTLALTIGIPQVISLPIATTGSVVVSINADGHYRLAKHSGSDHGIYYDTCPLAPLADAQQLETPEGTPLAIQLSGRSGEGDILTYSIVSPPSRGSITNFNPATGALTYTPSDPHYSGADSFTFIVNDGYMPSEAALVGITILPVNDPPTADAGPDQSVDEETMVNLVGSGHDDDGDILSFTWTQTAGPPVVLSGDHTATPEFMAPAVSSSTTLSFELTVSDGHLSAHDSVSIVVNTVLDGMATRTQGFWSTHFDLAQQVWASMAAGDRIIGSKNMGDGSGDAGELMGGFWSSVAKKTTGSKRSALDQARMQLVQQLLAAMLNRQAFNTDEVGAIAAGKSALVSSDIGLVLIAKSILEAYNLSGDGQALPASITAGSASPRTAESNANKAVWDLLP